MNKLVKEGGEKNIDEGEAKNKSKRKEKMTRGK
jgi:hypothetical protein